MWEGRGGEGRGRAASPPALLSPLFLPSFSGLFLTHCPIVSLDLGSEVPSFGVLGLPMDAPLLLPKCSLILTQPAHLGFSGACFSSCFQAMNS